MSDQSFTVHDPDTVLSPKSGMTRDHWIAAGHYVLERSEGLFDKDRAEFMPPRRKERNRLSARFEMFTRTMLLVLPLARADVATRVGGLPVDTFLQLSLEKFCNPTSPDWIGLPQPGKSPYQLVQWAGLVAGLFHGPPGLWEALPAPIREYSLDSLSACVSHRTNAHNWRFFNVLGAAFLERCGVPFDAVAERDHLLHILAWYAGDGWYRDGHDFDYYNAWAFQTYAALWSSLARSDQYPEIREELVGNLRIFMQSYPRMFTREGHSLLWGRSAVYRFAACTPLSEVFFLPESFVPAGLARRICSGNLLQFLRRDDTWTGPAPVLGYYREFSPIIQYYSQSSSFGWMHKAFWCLSLPASSPFWTEREKVGSWYEGDNQDDVCLITLDGPGLTITNDRSNGDVVLRSGKVRSASDACYNRLAYFGNYALEADTPGPPTSLSYEATSDAHGVATRLKVSQMRYAGEVGGVLYRQIYLGPSGGHHSEGILIDLADIAVPGGILRVDRVRASFPHVLWLGGFSVPGHHCLKENTPSDTIRYEIASEETRMAGSVMVPLSGWDGARAVHRNGTHAEYRTSTSIGLYRESLHPARGSIDIVSALIVHCNPKESEIPTITSIFSDGHPDRLTPTNGIRMGFPSGVEFYVNFDGIEGRLRN